MKPDEFRSRTRLRVRWAEVDPQGIVFNANYLTYVDTAGTEYWRAIGAPYPNGLEALGGDVYVKKATIEYASPARFDDIVDVGIRCDRIGRSSMTFVWAIFRGSEALVFGETVNVYVERALDRPAEVPAILRSAIGAYEAGETVFDVRVGPWGDLGLDARKVRDRVFIEEQSIEPAIERDDKDESSRHAVVYSRFRTPVATARLHGASGTARLGRVAVDRDQRGAGIGRLLVSSLVASAREQGFERVLVHAQAPAVPFFERLGFTRAGESFVEAGILHVLMQRAL